MQKPDETTGALSSTEMVGNVAQAIQKNALKYMIDNLNDADAQTLARAAIEAMREPTQEMEEKGGDLQAGFDRRFGRHNADEVWAAMIDAALSK